MKWALSRPQRASPLLVEAMQRVVEEYQDVTVMNEERASRPLIRSVWAWRALVAELALDEFREPMRELLRLHPAVIWEIGLGERDVATPFLWHVGRGDQAWLRAVADDTGVRDVWVRGSAVAALGVLVDDGELELASYREEVLSRLIDGERFEASRWPDGTETIAENTPATWNAFLLDLLLGAGPERTDLPRIEAMYEAGQVDVDAIEIRYEWFVDAVESTQERDFLVGSSSPESCRYSFLDDAWDVLSYSMPHILEGAELARARAPEPKAVWKPPRRPAASPTKKNKPKKKKKNDRKRQKKKKKR